MLGAAKLTGAAVLALALALWLATATSWGRARLLAVALGQADALLPGTLQVGTLTRLTPWGVTLTELRLRDPAGAEVIALGRVQAELDPASLLGGRFVITQLDIGPGHVDLRQLDAAGRGLLAALVDPEAPKAEAGGAPPYVRIDQLRLHGLSVRAPDLPPWEALELREIELSARVELDQHPRVQLEALTCRVFQGARPWLDVGPVAALLEHPGKPSWLRAQATIGGSSLRLAARGLLPPSPGFDDAPLTAELHVDELRATTLSDMLADPSLASLFAGALRLELSASGTPNDLTLDSILHAPAGPTRLRLTVEDQTRLELTSSARELVLRRLRADLPDEPLTFSVTCSAEIVDRSRIPLRLQLHSGEFGRHILPELSAQATWAGRALHQLSLEARRGQSSLQVTGDLDLDSGWDLETRAALHGTELGALAEIAGFAQQPAGELVAELRLKRTAAGDSSVAGQVGARGLTLAGLSLARGDVSIDVAGSPPDLSGSVRAELRGMRAGDTRLRRADLRLEGGPKRYRLRADADLPRLQAHADLQLQRRDRELGIEGAASGELDGTAFALTLAPTTLGPTGNIDTRGIEVQVDGQRLTASGKLGAAGSALVVSARQLELQALSRRLGIVPEIAGRAELEAHLSGSLREPVVRLQLSARQLRRSGSAPLDAALDARLDAPAGQLELQARLAPSGPPTPDALDAQLRLSSSFAAGPDWLDRLGTPEGSLRVDLRHFELEVLEPWAGRPLPVRGALGVQLALDHADGQLRAELGVADARGPWLDFDAELALPEGEKPADAGLAALLRELLANARWTARLSAARRPLHEAALGADLPRHLDIQGSLDVSHQPGDEPRARASARLTQNAAREAPAGCEVEGMELSLDAELERGQLTATVLGRHRQAELLRATSHMDVRLEPMLRGGSPRLGAVSSRWLSRQLDLTNVPFLCQRLKGTLDASVDIVDALGARPTLDVSVTASQLSLGAKPALDLKLQAHADHAAARAAADVTAPLGASRFEAALPISWSGGRLTVSPDARLSAQARLQNLPIAPLLDPAGAVSHAQGSVSGELFAEGPLTELVPSGHLEVQDAELTATALAQPLHGVRGRFAFKDKRIEITKLEARDRDGLLELNGRVELRDPSAVDTALTVKVTEFPLRQQGQVVATTSGEASINARITADRTDVAVVLKNADTWLEKAPSRRGLSLEAHPDVVVAGVARASADAPSGNSGAQPPGVGSSGRQSRLSLDATDHFWVKREDFAIQLSMRLVAQLGQAQTRVKGRVDLHRGYLDLMGRVFEIRRGSHLEFTGAELTDPVVAIEAAHERRSSGKTIHVEISGRASRPELRFFVDDREASAGEALEELVGRQSGSSEESARSDAASFVSGLTAGLLATSARRELGAAAPIIMIEPGAQTGEGRLRAGFELDSLIPDALASLITGVYLEGIVTKEEAAGQQSTQAGVLVELYFPHQLFSTGQWGPGATWSIDWGWQL